MALGGPHAVMRFFRLFLMMGCLCPGVELWASGRTRPPSSLPGPGQTWISVQRFAREYGFQNVTPRKEYVTLSGKLHVLHLYRGSRRAVLDGTIVWLNQPFSQVEGTWVLHAKDAQLTLPPLLRPSEVLKDQGFQVVVLDPGHGGHDPGASYYGMNEKDVALDIARRVRAILQKRGVRVYLTRHDDRYLQLVERPRRAKRWNADAFVSIHLNAAAKHAQGIETFALSIPGSLSTNQDPNSAPPLNANPGNQYDQANMALSYAVHHSLSKLPGTKDRGVKRARFAVLKTAPCAATLVEVGFLSHAQEGKRFKSAAYRDQVARSIAQGIDKYLRAVKTARMSEPVAPSEK